MRRGPPHADGDVVAGRLHDPRRRAHGGRAFGSSRAVACAWSLALAATVVGLAAASAAHDVARARIWLVERVDRAARAPIAGADAIEHLALAIRALAAGEAREPETAVLEHARAALRSTQRDDGGFGAGELDAAARTRATWTVLGALRLSGEAADVAACDRARRFVDAGQRPADGGSDHRALAFLREVRSDELESESLFTLAGGRFDVRAAFRAVVEAGELSQSPSIASVPSSELRRLAAVASLLEDYRVRQDAATIWSWRESAAWLRSELDRSWHDDAGAFGDRQRGEPSIEATACALMLSEIARTWTGVAGASETAGATDSTRVAVLSDACEQCHATLQPELDAQWRHGAHGRAGVGCADCHGVNHSLIFRDRGRVSAAACGVCHERAAEEFARSRHAHAERTLLESPLFAATPPAAREACLGCHRIGAKQSDGTEGSCNYCHPAHAFEAAAARSPQACTVCHTGDDYPQDLAFARSKHGALFATAHDAASAPSCATCHHSGGTHDDGFGITIGGGGIGGVLEGTEPPIPMQTVTHEAFARGRAEMLSVCTRCHSSRLAEESLRAADAIKLEGDAMLAQAVELLRGLHREGLLGLDPKDELVLGPSQIPPDPALEGAPALQRFYEMWRFHYTASWKGAYHGSFSIANQSSRAGLREDLEFLRAQASVLRGERGALR